MNRYQLLWIVFIGITTCLSAQRVIIHFDSPLTSAPSLSKAALRYDKDFAYSLTFDDGGVDGFTCALPVLEGGTAQCNGASFSGLSFTDGCGNNLFFKAGLAWNAANALGQDAHDGRITSKMTWQQLDAVYDKGWDVFNHSFSHKARSTNTLSNQDYITEIEMNRTYVRDRTRNKIEMPLFVVPSGDVTYQNIAYERGQQLVFDQAANTIAFGGLSVKTDFTPNGRVIHRQLMEDMLNSGRDRIGAVANLSINGEKIWYNEFTHSINGTTGLTFDGFKTHLERIANSWGKNGSDRVWMAPLQEVYEYLTVRQNISYTARIDGNQLILDFNLAQLPTWLRRKPFTLVINTGGNFSRVEVPQNMKMSFKGTGSKKIINFDFAGVSAIINACDTDSTPPTFANCPQNISLSTTVDSAVATWTAPNVSDNCSVPILSSNFKSGQKFPVGITTVTYTAQDAKNNIANCRFTITITKIGGNNICISKSNAPWSDWIKEVKLGSFSNSSDKTRPDRYVVGYSDYKDKIIPVKRSLKYPLSIAAGTGWEGTNFNYRVWIDFNGNKIFEDSEKAFDKLNTKSAVSDSISIPASAKLGTTTMRVSMKKDGAPTACETFDVGEVEDYTLNVEDAIIVINACDTDNIAPIFTNCPTNNIVATTIGTSANVNFTPLTATDNCGTPSVSGSHQPNQTFSLGTTHVRYIARDAKGNQTQCNFSVIVNAVQDTSKKADLSLTIKASSMTFRQWTSDTFTITLKNNGTINITNIKVEFKYPAKTSKGGSTTLSMGTWREFCANGQPCYEWAIENLAPNQTATLTVPLFVLDAIQPLIATAKLLSSTPANTTVANNQATVIVQLAPSTRRIVSATDEKPTQFLPLVIQAIAPNPTEGEIIVNVESLLSQNVRFDFFNILGITIYSEIKKVYAGNNQLHFNLSERESGIYFIKSSVGGGRKTPVKIVKL